MKIALQYVKSTDGVTQSVQVPFPEWEKLLLKIKKYEQALKLKKDLTQAFEEVAQIRESRSKKQSLNDFLNEI
jgi:uncharacterized protein YoxC